MSRTNTHFEGPKLDWIPTKSKLHKVQPWCLALTKLISFLVKFVQKYPISYKRIPNKNFAAILKIFSCQIAWTPGIMLDFNTDYGGNRKVNYTSWIVQASPGINIAKAIFSGGNISGEKFSFRQNGGRFRW